MKDFAIVVAMDEARGIGKAGQLAWHLPQDLKHFKEITCATKGSGAINAVIMGRKTWESLPEKFRPLPNRINIVITSQPDFTASGAACCLSLQKALDYAASRLEIESVFVIGGGQIFQQAIAAAACQGIFATIVQGNFHCDAFFPPIPARFKPVHTSPWQTEKSLTFRFIDYHFA